MTRKLTAVFATGLLGFLLVGCSSAPGLVRGQCPPGGNCQGQCYGGQYGQGQCYGGSGQCQGSCNNRNCGSCNLPCHPVHRNYYDFDVPNDLSYPQNDTPAAVVQYPYYTLKGPTDFFMK